MWDSSPLLQPARRRHSIIPALSLAGIPPFSGFVAKLALLQEGVALDRGVIVAVSLAVSLLTLFSMSKIWGGIFWGKPTSASERVAPAMTLATGAVVVLSLAVAVFAGPLSDLAARAAADLIDPAVYTELVLGGS